jgi:hypothetical protein
MFSVVEGNFVHPQNSLAVMGQFFADGINQWQAQCGP